MKVGCAHRGLASAILHIKSLSSRFIPVRPDRLCREIQVQKRRNPCRCQPMTVSGLVHIQSSEGQNVNSGQGSLASLI
jgi:hypothetical protein